MNRYLENKIFILILFLIFILWATLILFITWIDKRVEKLENKTEVIYEIN